MILVGSQRGNAQELARHLMKPENERVEVHQLRGFAARDLQGAFQESEAISRATKCRKHLYSLSFNPPPEAEVSDDQFESAIDRAEDRLGLGGQPRAIVFHVKDGRLHAHAVWCRIDTEEMKAIPLPYDKRRLKDVSRDLYLEHGWTMPRGFVSHEARDPRNYSLAEWQHAKRAKRDPKVLKGQFQDAWAISDSKVAFEAALQERGFVLARGDRRGHVAVDHTGEVYPISRWTGQKTKTVKARLGELGALPSVGDARDRAAARVAERLEELKAQERRDAEAKQQRLSEARERAARQHRQERHNLTAAQNARQSAEADAREQRLRKGLLGLLDRLTGRRRRTLAENAYEAAHAQQRDRAERQQTLAQQARLREDFKTKSRDREARRAAIFAELNKDLKELRTPASRDARKEAYQSKRRRSERPNRARDGPTPEP